MRDFREQNFYELLEVKPHASPQELERSYQRARRCFSSESVATYALFQPDELNLLRRRIEEAYRVLSDPERRRMYDRELAALQGEIRSGPPVRADEPIQQDEPPAVREVPGQVSLLPDDEPAEEKPAEEKPTEEKPTEEKPTEEKPAEEKPTEEKPAEEKPAEETAVEEAADEEKAGPAESEEEASAVTQPVETDDSAGEAEETQPAADEPDMQKEDTAPEPDSAAEQPPALPPMPLITEETVVDGTLMRQVREARGISLQEIADITKIAIYYLRNMEENQFEDLPAPVYVRGYLRQIATILELNTEWFAKGFLDLIKESK